MTTWITTLGESPFAAINTLWAVLKEKPPAAFDRVIVFCPQDQAENVEKFRQWGEALFQSYRGKQPDWVLHTFAADDIPAFRTALKEAVHKCKGKVIMDMTSGRKAVSALILLIGDLFSGKVEGVYYTFLHDADYSHFPYPAIPAGTSELVEMLEG